VAQITAGLVRHGKDPYTPAALISRGTMPDQRLAVGTLAGLATLAHGFASPALIVVGEVVAVGSALAAAAAAPAHAA